MTDRTCDTCYFKNSRCTAKGCFAFDQPTEYIGWMPDYDYLKRIKKESDSCVSLSKFGDEMLYGVKSPLCEDAIYNIFKILKESEE